MHFGIGYDYNQSYSSSPYGSTNDHLHTQMTSQNNFDSSKFAGMYSAYNQNNGCEISGPETENIKSELDTSSSDLNLNDSYELSKSPIDDALEMEFNGGVNMKVGDISRYLPATQKSCTGTNNDANTMSKWYQSYLLKKTLFGLHLYILCKGIQHDLTLFNR